MAFSDPHHILEHFGLHEGQVVADLGAGSGFYTLDASKRVGTGGSVYAIDVQADLLARLRVTLAEQHVNNVHYIHGDIEQKNGTKIHQAIVDVVLACNVLFQAENKQAFIEEIKRILKPGGRVLFIEWTDSFGGLGPQPEYIITHDTARELFTKNGFEEISMIEAGDHHYGLIFRKP